MHKFIQINQHCILEQYSLQNPDVKQIYQNSSKAIHKPTKTNLSLSASNIQKSSKHHNQLAYYIQNSSACTCHALNLWTNGTTNFPTSNHIQQTSQH